VVERAYLIESYLEEASLEELYGDDMLIKAAPSIGHIDSIHTKPLDLTSTSSSLLPTIPSHLHAFYESLGDIRGFHLSFDPYCAYLEDVSRK